MIVGPLAFTVNSNPELDKPATVTTTLPVVAPVGTGATIWFVDHTVGVAAVPLKVTVLVPCVAPKFEPEIVTVVPMTPELGESPESVGVTATVNGLGLLAIPDTVTSTLPLVAPVGTGAAMLVELQLVAVEVTPLNEIVFVPWLLPKFVPEIVTEVPTTPDGGLKLVMLGPAINVKVKPLLAIPPTFTTTFPVVAPVGTVTTIPLSAQLVAVAPVPLKVTVLVPCEPPKFAPEIRTVFPTSPDTGDRFVIFGVGSTVNPARLLLRPLT